jgi:hypothetical protein
MGPTTLLPSLPPAVLYSSLGLTAFIIAHGAYRALRRATEPPAEVDSNDAVVRLPSSSGGQESADSAALENDRLRLTRQYSAFTDLFDALPDTILDETVPIPGITSAARRTA